MGAVDPLVSRAEEAVAAAGGGRAFPTLEAALGHEAWSVGVVATPSSMHVEPATILAGVGTHVLVEKPLSDRLDGVADVLAVAERTGVVAMMAMCYRYHPALLRIKQLLDEGAVGPVVAARCEGGFYLPWWHPERDYRQEYAAQAALGGGVLLTSIHTLDYVRWLFGEVTEVTALLARVGSLAIDVEDVAAGLCRTERGIVVGVWLDYLQRLNEHRIQITGETGDLQWSMGDNRLLRIGPERGQVTEEILPADGAEGMYLRELEVFLDAVRRGVTSPIPLSEGVRDLELTQVFRQAAAEGRRVAVPRRVGAGHSA